MGVTLAQIKELRERTGVGIQSVKEALDASGGDSEKAIKYLREKGIAKAAKRAGRSSDKGFIAHYVHGEGQLAVLVELNSETDFAARTDRFKELAHDIALHIAANTPEYINIEDIPEKVLDQEKEVYKKDIAGKPEQVQAKILEGKLSKFYEEVVLLEQHFVKDDSKKVKDVLNENIAAIGENVKIGRFVRFEIANPTSSCGLDD
jgi:elongation factor Ts